MDEEHKKTEDMETSSENPTAQEQQGAEVSAIQTGDCTQALTEEQLPIAENETTVDSEIETPEPPVGEKQELEYSACRKSARLMLFLVLIGFFFATSYFLTDLYAPAIQEWCAWQRLKLYRSPRALRVYISRHKLHREEAETYLNSIEKMENARISSELYCDLASFNKFIDDYHKSSLSWELESTYKKAQDERKARLNKLPFKNQVYLEDNLSEEQITAYLWLSDTQRSQYLTLSKCKRNALSPLSSKEIDAYFDVSEDLQSFFLSLPEAIRRYCWSVAPEKRAALVRFLEKNEDEACFEPNYEMPLINPGIFSQGAESAGSDENLTFYAMISYPFWSGSREVTQELWESVMGNNPSLGEKNGSFAVNNINWYEAVEFCKAFTERHKAEIPAGYAFRLPSETEWEYCCKGESTQYEYTPLPTDDEIEEHKRNLRGDKFTYMENKRKKKPNANELQHLYGNVSEWCLDWYTGSSYLFSLDGDEGSYSEHGTQRVVRGGNLSTSQENNTCTYRDCCKPSDRNENLGFRMVLAPMNEEITQSLSQKPLPPNPNAPKILDIQQGLEYTAALDSDGRLWHWGVVSYRGRKDGEAIIESTPVPMKLPTEVGKIVAFDTDSSVILALCEDNSLWKWHVRSFDKDNKNNTAKSNSPVKIKKPQGMGRIAKISGKCVTPNALCEDGTIWRWGKIQGQIVDEPTKLKFPGDERFISVKGDYAIAEDGKLWFWENNYHGEEEIPKDYFLPKLFGTEVERRKYPKFVDFADTDKLILLCEDGTYWYLGDSDTYFSIPCFEQNTPIQVNSPLKSLTSDSYLYLALCEDGNVLYKGLDNSHIYLRRRFCSFEGILDLKLPWRPQRKHNSRMLFLDGREGLDFQPKTMPKDMKRIEKIRMNYHQLFFIDCDGNVWASGSDEYGALGTGTFLNTYVPIKLTFTP